nr:RNA-directed DNA polymerase, eukaryota, nucleotide-binding alpha-beta plait domain protein [Tanacetum cinerariifolium]
MASIYDAKLAETMAKHCPEHVCKYYPDYPSYPPPPTSKPSRLEKSMVALADIMAKLELASKRLATSTANLVPITSKTTFTTNESNTRLETTLQKLICQPTITKKESNDSTSNTNTDIIENTTEVLTRTSSLATNINKPNNTMANLITDSASFIAKIESEVVTHIPLSPLSSLHANPTHKKPEFPHDIAILHRTTLNETYGRTPLIASMLAIFHCVETFPPSHQCSSAKFVILQSEDEPPWEPHNLKYIIISLEDKARFEARSHRDQVMHNVLKLRSSSRPKAEPMGWLAGARPPQSDQLAELDLWKLCQSYGTVVDVYTPNRRSKAEKRFAFVRFIKVDNVDRPVENL